jgi:hypothetical protein
MNANRPNRSSETDGASLRGAPIVPVWVVGLIGFSACARDEGLTILRDTGFRTDAATIADSGGTEDTDPGTGCSLLDSEQDCAALERCAPSLTGENLCVPAGDLSSGSPCGDDGADRCQRGLICLAAEGQTSVCQTLCDPAVTAPCPAAQSCVGPQWLLAAGAGVCTP